MNNIDEKQASKLPLFASLDPGTQLNIFETLLFLDAQLSKQNKNKRVLRLDDSDTELPSMEALAAYIIASRKYRAEET